MENRFITALLAAAFLVMLDSASVAQSPRNAKLPVEWFIARVVDVKPFTVEYIDGIHLREVYNGKRPYEFSLIANPHSKNENVEQFKIGDIVRGDFCHPFLNCPDGTKRAFEPPRKPDPQECLTLPPPIAINLKKLNDSYKTRYATTGMLVTYHRRDTEMIDSITITRDGTLRLISINGGEIQRRLSRTELRELRHAFFQGQLDQLNKPRENYFAPSLQTIFGKVRHALPDEPSVVSDPFIVRLEKLIERFVDSAEYRITYRWRARIKDWRFGDIFPLDEAEQRGWDFLDRNRGRLARSTVPKQFFVEAKERYSEWHRFLYRFKGRLYYFSFGACDPTTTGSWMCSQTYKAGKRDPSGTVIGEFERWPPELATKLYWIPRNALLTDDNLFAAGIPIAREDFRTHRDFYIRLVGGGREFREGEAVYWDVTVAFR